MTNDEIFAAWSPENSPWSTWAKPVLFAHLGEGFLTDSSTHPLPEVSWSPDPIEKTALVLDLPGEEGVWVGSALAVRGYRLVPLYNAVPLPFVASILDSTARRSVAAVNVLPIISALRQNAERLARLNVPSNAPPAFLLDSNRHGNGQQVGPEEFDNRSVCFTTDFPSANFLAGQGIQRVLLVQRERSEPLSDLAHVLRGWQDGGLALERLRLDLSVQREAFTVKRPAWYRTMFQRALSATGLRRAPLGGFGNWMPGASG